MVWEKLTIMLLADGTFLARFGDGVSTFPTTTILVIDEAGNARFIGELLGERRSPLWDGPKSDGLGGNKGSAGVSFGSNLKRIIIIIFQKNSLLFATTKIQIRIFPRNKIQKDVKDKKTYS